MIYSWCGLQRIEAGHAAKFAGGNAETDCQPPGRQTDGPDCLAQH
jgi:hypothetical protein